MAKSDVTEDYMNLMTYSKYASRTSDAVELEGIKDQMADAYLNPNGCMLPDKKYTRCLALLVAHYYAMDDTQSPDSGGSDRVVGTVTSERVSEVSRSRGNQPYIGTVKGSNTFLLQSKWGVEFLYLMKTFKPAPIVT